MKFFEKFKRQKVTPTSPMSEIVKVMRDKEMSFCDEVIEIIYSKDETMRYVVLKSEKGYFSYVLEKIELYDEEEWTYLSDDYLPGYWVEFGNKTKSVLEKMEDTLREIENEGEYKMFF